MFVYFKEKLVNERGRLNTLLFMDNFELFNSFIPNKTYLFKMNLKNIYLDFCVWEKNKQTCEQ
jgi:hypothetical protein